MKVIFSGLESSGKSLRLAMQATELVERNSKWFDKQAAYWKKYGPEKFQEKYEIAAPTPRDIYSNLKFTQEFEYWAREEMNVNILYWENVEDLILIQDADVLIDEVGNYFDARGWESLSLDLRRWLTQGAKSGIEIYGTAQDFAQVDKAFRRLVNHLLHIKKIAGSRRPTPTMPPVKFIWGLCLVVPLDPQNYDEDENKFEGASLLDYRLFYIRKQYCEIFDTTQKIKRSVPLPYKHSVRRCEDATCHYYKVIHA